MSDLPVNIDATYADNANDASVKLHQQYHDTLHGQHNFMRRGGQVKLVYRQANTRWEFPDGTVPVLTGRTASITWEGTAAQIPAQGTGVSQFRVGDTALVRSTSL